MGDFFVLLFEVGEFLFEGPAVFFKFESFICFFIELIIEGIRVFVELLDLGLKLAVFENDKIELIFETGNFVIDPVVVNVFRVEEEFGEQEDK